MRHRQCHRVPRPIRFDRGDEVAQASADRPGDPTTVRRFICSIICFPCDHFVSRSSDRRLDLACGASRFHRHRPEGIDSRHEMGCLELPGRRKVRPVGSLSLPSAVGRDMRGKSKGEVRRRLAEEYCRSVVKRSVHLGRAAIPALSADPFRANAQAQGRSALVERAAHVADPLDQGGNWNADDRIGRQEGVWTRIACM
jgi:hypothetical protein